MFQFSSNFSNKPGRTAGGPLANALVIIGGVLMVGIFIVLGFFAFLLLAGVMLVLSAVVGVRVWWFKRKLAGSMNANGPEEQPGSSAAEGQVIEGEFKVVEKHGFNDKGDRPGH